MQFSRANRDHNHKVGRRTRGHLGAKDEYKCGTTVDGTESRGCRVVEAGLERLVVEAKTEKSGGGGAFGCRVSDAM
jgi:hypothetical protein